MSDGLTTDVPTIPGVDLERVPGLYPRGNRVLVVRHKETTQGSIIIPDTAQEASRKATVLRVGPGRVQDGECLPIDLHAGDTVLVLKYAGSEIKIDGIEFVLVEDSDILCTVDADELLR